MEAAYILSNALDVFWELGTRLQDGAHSFEWKLLSKHISQISFQASWFAPPSCGPLHKLMIYFSPWHHTHIYCNNSFSRLQVSLENIKPWVFNWLCLSPVHNLCVMFDIQLSFVSHINTITKTSFFHLRNIAKIRPSGHLLMLKSWFIPSLRPRYVTVLLSSSASSHLFLINFSVFKTLFSHAPPHINI